MKLRLYLDEDSLHRALVEGLRARGADIETALEAGMIARADEDHLQHAASKGRVLFTFNVGDFCRLHSEWLTAARSHGGIIVSPQQKFSVGDEIRKLLNLIAKRPAEEMQNQLEYLSSW